MSRSAKFEATEVRSQFREPRGLILGSIGVASIVVALNLLYKYVAPGLMANGLWPVLVRTAAAYLPITLTLWHRRLDKWTAFMFAVLAYAFSLASFSALNLIRTLLGSEWAIDSTLAVLAYYGSVFALISVTTYVCVDGLIRAFYELDWRLALWIRPFRWRWLSLVLSADGTLGIAIVLALAARWIGLAAPEVARATDTLSLALLLVPPLLQWIRARTGRLLTAPAGLTVVEEREWWCEQLDTTCHKVRAKDAVGVSRSLWSKDRSVIAVCTTGPEGNIWLMTGGRLPWDKHVWRIPSNLLCRLRPELEPFLGLGPGWVVITAPARVWFDPEVATRVAAAFMAGQTHRNPEHWLEAGLTKTTQRVAGGH